MDPDKYPQRKSTRLKRYDYSAAGWYYVTICTYKHEELLGHVKKGRMVLNDCGKIAEKAWQQIPSHHPGVTLDQYVVMPNHIHGIIIIGVPVGARHASPVANKNSNPLPATKSNLTAIVGSFKAAVSKEINKVGAGAFGWQRSFYDHHIRADKSLRNIREYIANNSAAWVADKENLDDYLPKSEMP